MKLLFTLLLCLAMPAAAIGVAGGGHSAGGGGHSAGHSSSGHVTGAHSANSAHNAATAAHETSFTATHSSAAHPAPEPTRPTYTPFWLWMPRGHVESTPCQQLDARDCK